MAIDSVHYGRTAYALGSNVFRCSGHFILSSRDTVSNNFSRRHVLISVNQYIIESRRFSLSKTNSQHISPSTLAPLQRILHAAARTVLDLKLGDHVTPALLELHWLPITERIQYKLCLLVHKMFVGHAPDYIASLLMPTSDIPSRSSLRSSSNCDLVVPRTSRKIGDMAFSVAAPRAWNRLPTDSKLLRSTASFKSKLKSFMFHAAYTGNTTWTLECTIGLIVAGALQVTVVTVC